MVLPLRGEAHPRGSRSDSDAPWWDTRGTGEPSLRRRTPKHSMGSYNRVVQEQCISFHSFAPKWEPLLRVDGAAILLGNKTEAYVELFAFTREYVERLREGDPSTELHFVTYFDQLLRIKLRARMLASETVEDLRQETYIRCWLPCVRMARFGSPNVLALSLTPLVTTSYTNFTGPRRKPAPGMTLTWKCLTTP